MSKFPTEKAVLVLDDLDKPIKGAEAIRAARGYVETLQQTFYALENGHIPARKRGRFWETTLRLLMSDAPAPAAPATVAASTPGAPTPDCATALVSDTATPSF
jgi:hypothetical protein